MGRSRPGNSRINYLPIQQIVDKENGLDAAMMRIIAASNPFSPNARRSAGG
jgi:hypothetical protein